jgi:hypothetical protein
MDATWQRPQPEEVKAARVIPWELPLDTFGVAVDHVDGRHSAYVVGSKEAAEAEVRRLSGQPHGASPLHQSR